MRTQLRRIIFRAGLTEWERTFQNLRASASTDIEAELGGTAESVFVGHSQRMPLKHYLQLSDAVLERAANWNKDKCETTAEQDKKVLRGNPEPEPAKTVKTDEEREIFPFES